MDNKYKNIALGIAEEYGLVNYKLDGKYLIWNVSYPEYLNTRRYTVQHKLNLANMVEITKVLKRYDINGECNR